MNRLHTDVGFICESNGQAELSIGEQRSQLYHCSLRYSSQNRDSSSQNPFGTSDEWSTWELDASVVIQGLEPCVEGTEAVDDHEFAGDEPSAAAVSAPAMSASGDLPMGSEVLMVTRSGTLCRGKIGQGVVVPIPTFLNMQVLRKEKVLRVCCGTNLDVRYVPIAFKLIASLLVAYSQVNVMR